MGVRQTISLAAEASSPSPSGEVDPIDANCFCAPQEMHKANVDSDTTSNNQNALSYSMTSSSGSNGSSSHKAFVCLRCGKSYAWRVSLYRHLREECGRYSPKKLLKRQDNLPKLFPCHQCDKSYKNKGSLKRHLQVECYKEPKFICDICHRGFKQKDNFKRHAFTIHGISFMNVRPPRESRIAMIRPKPHRPQ
ncbi:Zinc finger and BTB domain-containing protein 17 [Harpegnathos saltator]|uniref:Zinc finger and BTB domain-containing protein 17 n=1 Tax=Harpegnathos saltator TaxID=610380 RepID=E2BJC6_HARSA|nr:Zinc finger and BTB domain-containing protein 17 [Harpegnathos saltator]